MKQTAIFGLLLLAGVLIGRYWKVGLPDRAFSDRTKMEQLIQLVHDQYVDTVDLDEVENKALNNFLTSFDPHSIYIASSDVQQANQDLKGSFVGIGVEFQMIQDTPFIARVIPGGPAENAGLLVGDRIISADDSSLLNKLNTAVVAQLKGDAKSIVVLHVYRKHSNEYVDIPIERGTVPLKTVESLRLDDSTVYFKIAHFANPTHDEFTEQWRELEKNGKNDRVIMDLRNNPGGYLQTSVQLLDEFIDSEDRIAYTKGKGSKGKEYFASFGGVATDAKVICFVNHRSASASEIFSGAIQDLDRGVILGSSTYGKGLVQETFELADKSQVRLTVSRYYIPSGRSIQRPYGESGYHNFDSIPSEEKEWYKTKNGREVSSNGGIEPDIAIKTEGAGIKDWDKLYKVAIKILDEDYDKIKSFSSAQEFYRSTLVEDSKFLASSTSEHSAEVERLIADFFWGDLSQLNSPNNQALMDSSDYAFEKYDDLLNSQSAL